MVESKFDLVAALLKAGEAWETGGRHTEPHLSSKISSSVNFSKSKRSMAEFWCEHLDHSMASQLVMRFSRIYLPLMKPVWVELTNLGRILTNLRAIILAKQRLKINEDKF